MTDRFDYEGLEMPDELRELDAELSSIRYEERPSFGPELEAELAGEWSKERRGPRLPLHQLAAAAVVGLLLVGAVVPSARASLVRLIGVLQSGSVEASAPGPASSPPLQLAPFEPPAARLDDENSGESRILPMEPPPSPETVSPGEWPEPTLPEISDRARAEALIRRAYPMKLQREGVGGTVRLLLWVDTTGAVDFVNLGKGSGVPELDRAALQVAPSLEFDPARRRGSAVGTWVEFDVRFKPNFEESDPFALPVVDPVDHPEIDASLDLTLISEWQRDIMLPAPVQREASEILAAALTDDGVIERLGSVESILAGDPPAGVAPTTWRIDASAVLEEAMVRDPDNPAPLLALARIRRKQGLRTEARILFERGLRRAMRGGNSVSPFLLAELHYERGLLLEESWLASRRLGQLRGEAFSEATCPRARSSGGAATGVASVERVTAWNYLCPGQLENVFDHGFEETGSGTDADLTLMMASFRAAVEAYPAHVGANVEILLTLADERRWEEMFEGARRFVWASKGHPYGLLLGGLALQRLSRSEEARGQFALALRGMPEAEANELSDVRFIIPKNRVDEYRILSGEERRRQESEFWAVLDPILATPVNERAVEHLARATYAHFRFGSALSDAGEVWVRYGRPDQIRVVGERVGLRTEFWDYGNGPDITFSRWGAADRMDLTPEGRAYVDDLRDVFPHRYGSLSRTVFTLPAQVTRFRGADGVSTDVQVDTEVPALLATGASDTLDLGVFLLGAGGEKVAMTQRKILGETVPVSLRISVSPAVVTVVVEFFNRTKGQAVSLRESVPLGSGAPESISELLLMGTATPSVEDLDRSADWMKPYLLQGPIEVEALGVFFELYDLAPAARWYRLRAEVIDRDTGEVYGVPVSPAGQDGFRPTWDRYPAAEGPTKEFVTVALSGVPPGNHTLRVVIDVPDAGTALVAERDFESR